MAPKRADVAPPPTVIELGSNERKIAEWPCDSKATIDAVPYVHVAPPVHPLTKTKVFKPIRDSGLDSTIDAPDRRDHW